MDSRLTPISSDDVEAFISSEPCRTATVLGPNFLAAVKGARRPDGFGFCAWVDSATFDVLTSGPTGAEMRVVAFQAPTGGHIGAIELRAGNCLLVILGDLAAHRTAFTWALETELLQLLLFDGKRLANASWDLPLTDYGALLTMVRDAVQVPVQAQYIGIAMAAVSCKKEIACDAQGGEERARDVTIAVLGGGASDASDEVARPPAARELMH